MNIVAPVSPFPGLRAGFQSASWQIDLAFDEKSLSLVGETCLFVKTSSWEVPERHACSMYLIEAVNRFIIFQNRKTLCRRSVKARRWK